MVLPPSAERGYMVRRAPALQFTHTWATAQSLALPLAIGSTHSINSGCSVAKGSIWAEPMATAYSTTYGDTCPTQTSPPRTKGDFREPAFDLELLSLPPSGLLRVGGFFLSPVVLCRNCPC